MPSGEPPFLAVKPVNRWAFSVWLATGFGVGFIPYAPGTFGSVLGVAVGWAIGHIPSIGGQLLVVGGLLAIGIPICTRAVSHLGGKKDPGCVVWDEIASMPLVYLALDVSNAWLLVAGFVLFRLFDISKPPPARNLERLPDGWGVMADDIVAAIYACIALHTIVWLGWLPTLDG